MLPLRFSRQNKDRPRRPAKSPKEIRRRRHYDALNKDKNRIPAIERLFYAFITGLLFSLAGVILDLFITLIRSMLNSGDGSVFWLFAPLLLVLGALIGGFSGRLAGADSMDMIGAKPNNHLDEVSIKYDIMRGIGIGILLFGVIWLLLLVLS